MSSGEVMHSVSNPAEEANALYIEQSRLAERLLVNPRPAIDRSLEGKSDVVGGVADPARSGVAYGGTRVGGGTG
jgi:hypothetical protein